MNDSQGSAETAAPRCNFCMETGCAVAQSGAAVNDQTTCAGVHLARVDIAAGEYRSILDSARRCNPGKAHVVTPLVVNRYEIAYSRVAKEMKGWLHCFFANRAMPVEVRQHVDGGEYDVAFALLEKLETVRLEERAAQKAFDEDPEADVDHMAQSCSAQMANLVSRMSGGRVEDARM